MSLWGYLRHSRIYQKYLEHSRLHCMFAWIVHPVLTVKHLLKVMSPNINRPGYWDGRYEKMNEWRTNVYEFIIPLLKKWETEGKFTLMDIGCGLGDGCIFVKSNFSQADVSGADLSPLAINKANKRFPQGHFFQHDIVNDKLPNQYDYVLMVSILEHLEKPYQAVDNALASVKKALIIHCPYKEVPIVEPDHYHYFVEDTLSRYRPDVSVLGGRIVYIIRPERLE